MLADFLRAWLGAWPPSGAGFDVVGDAARTRPKWDGGEQLAIGVSDGDGRGVLSVPPAAVDEVRALVAAPDPEPVLRRSLPKLLDRPDATWFTGVFRWTTAPADLPDAGVWEEPGVDALPEWLRPFGAVLIAREPRTGDYLAGVGLKHHDRTGIEISVGTEPAARGKGLARRLVAQAARKILADGAVPTYLHDPTNAASARVAEAAGFKDEGWHVHALG